LSEIVSALGLKIRSLPTADVIDHETGIRLDNELDQISTQLYGKLSADLLVKAAADATFFDDEIGIL
jgi:hypothetical protein